MWITMKKDAILEILSDWNFWAKKIDSGIKRKEYLKEIIKLITKTNQIVCITGIRRSGNSRSSSSIIPVSTRHAHPGLRWNSSWIR